MDILTPAQQRVLRKLVRQDVFRLAVQNAFNHIVITDADGIILYANQATQRITGYAQQEIIGQTPQLWGGQMDADYYRRLWRIIKAERRPFIGELTNKRKNGELYGARIVISPIVTEANELIGFIGTEEDLQKYPKK